MVLVQPVVPRLGGMAPTNKKGNTQMSTFIVTYDLRKQGQNYSGLTKKLEAYPVHWHMQGSVWIIQTAQTAVQIRDNLLSSIDANDTLFVGRLQGEAAWHGFNTQAGEWLKRVLV